MCVFIIVFIKEELHIQHSLEMSHQRTNRDLNQHLQKKKKTKKTNCGVRCEGEGGGSVVDAKK